jgi:hypothetical protein
MTSPSLSDPQARAVLTSRFVDAQDLDRQRAEQLAEHVLVGPEDIARSALEWARTGNMPSEPEVHGESPRTLSERFTPTQVFTGLMLLRSDPHTALRVLRRGVDRGGPPEFAAAPASIGEGSGETLVGGRFAMTAVRAAWRLGGGLVASRLLARMARSRRP